jgi:Fe2+ transport system protein FeoA
MVSHLRLLAGQTTPDKTATNDGRCPLTACPAGTSATVLDLECPVPDANRLRTLGLFEGARVVVIGRRSGILLDVLGSRLALGRALADSIIVRVVGT